MNKIIDFDHSGITWLTKKEKSHGRFLLESAAEVINSNGASTTYFLLPEVMAGNVYGYEELPKLPPYHFQAAFSDKGVFKIWRTYEKYTDNNFGHQAEIFDTIDYTITFCEFVALKDNKAIYEAVLNKKQIYGEVSYKENNAVIKLCFPVKHINVKKESKVHFQVETGPLLLPIGGDKTTEDMHLAYVFFNKFSHAEFLVKDEKAGTYSVPKKCEAKIKLYIKE